MSDLLKQELKELAEYRASGLTPEQVRELAKYIRNLLKEMEDKNNG